MDGQAHERQAGRRLPFPCSQRTVTSVTSTEPWSWRAFRQQQPEAGGGRLLKRCPGLGPRVSWATQPQADPDRLGGGALGRRGAHTEDPHRPEKVTSGPQLQDLTSSPAGPHRTLLHVVGITLLPTLQTRTTRPWKGRRTGLPDRYLSTTSQETPLAPKSRAPAGPWSWRAADGR